MTAFAKQQVRRRGLSLLEVLSALTIAGVLAAIVMPRISSSIRHADECNCGVNRAVISIQTAVWRKRKGLWPQTDLSDIGNDPEYFPEGVPSCPVDDSQYTINRVDGRVNGHDH